MHVKVEKIECCKYWNSLCKNRTCFSGARRKFKFELNSILIMKNRNVIVTYFLITACFLAGCNKEKEITRQDLIKLINGPEGHSSTIWEGTYYCGTKNGYHYICHKKRSGNLLLKIKTNDLRIKEIQEFPLDEMHWIDISYIFQ